MQDTMRRDKFINKWIVFKNPYTLDKDFLKLKKDLDDLIKSEIEKLLPTEKEIKQNITYPEPISEHQVSKNIGFKTMNFLIGNVIKSPSGNLEVVIDVKGTKITTIPFFATNMTCYYDEEDRTYKKTCECYGHDPECEVCQGTGEYEILNKGYNKAVYVAPTIKDYILDSLRKNFNL